MGGASQKIGRGGESRTSCACTKVVVILEITETVLIMVFNRQAHRYERLLDDGIRKFEGTIDIVRTRPP